MPNPRFTVTFVENTYTRTRRRAIWGGTFPPVNRPVSRPGVRKAMLRRLGMIATLMLSLAPSPGRSDPCAAAITLAGIHDAYVALVRETGTIRDQAAISLLALLLPDADPAALTADLSGIDPPPDETRLRQVFAAATDHARAVAANPGTRPPPEHAAETDWLADVIHQSGCAYAWSTGQPPPTPLEISPVIRPSNGASARNMAVFILVAAAIWAVASIRRTRAFRRSQLPRLRRMPVALQATATLDGGRQAEVRILDLSLGGMKIALRDAPSPGTSLGIAVGGRELPVSVVWRNDFYAGVLFDTPLSRPALKDLLALSPGRAAGR